MICFRLSHQTYGYLTVISGFLWMLFCGSAFMIGNIAPYISSYYKESKQNEIETLFSINIGMSMFGNFIGANVLKSQIVHPKILVIVAGIIGIGGIYLSTYMPWHFFRFVFPTTYGFSIGLAFTTHLLLSWQYMP